MTDRAAEPYYEGGGVTLYHGDCREVLPGLGVVDLVLTDPPYGKGYHDGGVGESPLGATARGGRIGPRREIRTDGKNWAPIKGDAKPDTTIVPPLACLTKEGGAVYLFSQWMVAETWRQAMRDAGLRVRNQIVWVKPHHGAGDLQTCYGPRHEVVLFGAHGRHLLRGRREGDVWVQPGGSVRANRWHPTEKPEGLCRWLIGKSSDAGDLVLDPFAGSGTTLLAAKEMGRRAIGIEIEERFCEAAAERLSQEVLPLWGRP